MSKEAALAALTGTPAPTPAPAVVASPNPAPAPETPKSDAFAQLAKKETEIVRQREELKREKEATAKERAEAQAILKKEQEFEELRKKDVIQALKMKGFSEQDVINYLAENQPVELTPEQKAAKAAEEAAAAKIKAWEDEQAKAKAEEIRQRDAGLIQGFKGTISKTIQSDKDKYEYCAHYGAIAEDLVYETVLASIRDSQGKDIMTAKEAADLVEEYYEEQDKAMSTLKKRNPTPAAPAEPTKTPERTRTVTDMRGEPVKPAVTKTRTLSNGAVATAASAMKSRNETREQKRERLINSLREGKLA